MKTLFLALAAALLLGACAAGPEPVAAAERNCLAVDAQTGSHVIRRSDCRRPADPAPADALKK